MTSCAIHQPNFLPRLSTIAKLLSADIWVVLDDVQFCRRDYQHRARLARLDDPTQHQWLSLNVHLPHGRPTLIRDAIVIDTARCQRRVAGMLQEFYGRSGNWPSLGARFADVVDLIGQTDRLHEITERSTRVILESLGWTGTIVRSSTLDARADRSERLADLTRAVGADSYICGRGGARYLNRTAFDALGLSVDYFDQPAWIDPCLWESGHRLSTTWALARHGRITGEHWHLGSSTTSHRRRPLDTVPAPLAPQTPAAQAFGLG